MSDFLLDPENQVITTSSQTTLSVGAIGQDLIMFYAVRGPITGTNPTLQFTLQEVSETDGQTPVGQRVSASVITSTSQGTIFLSQNISKLVVFSITVSGTTPSFSGVDYSVLVKGTIALPSNVTNVSGRVSINNGPNILAVNPDGSINTNVVSAGNMPGLAITHNEITSVPANIETTIATITAPDIGQRVQKVEVSGDNVALYKVKVNGATISNKRSWWMNFNQTFNYERFDSGLFLTSGQVLTITVKHGSLDLGNFEATVLST